MNIGEKLSVVLMEEKVESGSMTGGSVLMDLTIIPNVLPSKSMFGQGKGLI